MLPDRSRRNLVPLSLSQRLPQFTQFTLEITEKALFARLEQLWFCQSLSGEFSGCHAHRSLVDVVFYRAVTMQRAIERGVHNSSNCAMCAVNTS